MNWQRAFGVGMVALAVLWGAELASMRLATGSKGADIKAHGLVSDFNGDGFADLAVGAPLDHVPERGAIRRAGSVTVLYGSPQGVSSNNQLWTQDSPGILDAAEPHDEFGSSLATGDFNGDGFSDLAVGSDESLGETWGAGAVNVIYGSAEGLSRTGNQFWHQDSPGIEGTSEGGEEFGRALAAGDFNGDGFADLAIGVPFEGGGFDAYGAVNVLYGTATGLSAEGNQLWNQDSPGTKGVVEKGYDIFGFALSSGDYNADGFADLAIGNHGERVGDIIRAGGVNVLYGSAAGLTARGDQLWHQDRRGIEDVAEDNDGLGSVLASGDFNDDGFDFRGGDSARPVRFSIRPHRGGQSALAPEPGGDQGQRREWGCLRIRTHRPGLQP